MNYLNGNKDVYYDLDNGSTIFTFRNESSEDKRYSNNYYDISFLFINGIVTMSFKNIQNKNKEEETFPPL